MEELNTDLSAGSYTIILRHDGINRYYPAENPGDAVVLMDALCRKYPEVELWKGNKLVQKYSVDFRL